MTSNEKWTKWRDKRKQDGWTRVQVFVPGDLALAIKQLIRRFRYEHPQNYKR